MLLKKVAIALEIIVQLVPMYSIVLCSQCNLTILILFSVQGPRKSRALSLTSLSVGGSMMGSGQFCPHRLHHRLENLKTLKLAHNRLEELVLVTADAEASTASSSSFQVSSRLLIAYNIFLNLFMPGQSQNPQAGPQPPGGVGPFRSVLGFSYFMISSLCC